MIILRKILIVFLLLLLTGCAAGHQLKKDNLLEVKKGETTCNKVLAVFGTPTRMEGEVREDERKRFIYESKESDPNFLNFIPLLDLFAQYKVTTETTTFVFDSNDIVSEIKSDRTETWYHSMEKGGYMVLPLNKEDLSNQQLCQDQGGTV